MAENVSTGPRIVAKAETVSTGKHGKGQLEAEVEDQAPLPDTGSPVVNLMRRMDTFTEIIQCGIGMGTSPSNWISKNNLPATCDTQGAQCVFNEAAASAICIAVDVRLREVMLEKLTAQYLERVYGDTGFADLGEEGSERARNAASAWADDIVAELWS